jgi:hypothetical protein
MSDILVTIHNAETGEIIQRPANKDELKQMAKDKADRLERQAVEAQKAAEKAAILDRIGLTADELKTILG